VRPTERLEDRRRILVIGSGGAGKSTFARELGRRTGLPLVHLDLHYWRPGWTPTPPDEWLGRVRDLVREDRWIIDGNYLGSLEVRQTRPRIVEAMASRRAGVELVTIRRRSDARAVLAAISERSDA
jgi:hypothetical protein